MTPTSPTDDRVTEAPWTEDEVASLNDYQRSGRMHPFTCVVREIPPHRDDDVLTATTEGWVCEVGSCEYRQEWAWVWMADWSWSRA